MLKVGELTLFFTPKPRAKPCPKAVFPAPKVPLAKIISPPTNERAKVLAKFLVSFSVLHMNFII